jgi:hypothetical protein
MEHPVTDVELGPVSGEMVLDGAGDVSQVLGMDSPEPHIPRVPDLMLPTPN